MGANDKKYHEFLANFQNFDWTSYINAVFADLSAEVSIGQGDKIIAVEPEYFNALNELLPTYGSRTMGNELH